MDSNKPAVLHPAISGAFTPVGAVVGDVVDGIVDKVVGHYVGEMTGDAINNGALNIQWTI